MAQEPTLREIAAELRKVMQCNCDLDKWEPERTTGHSFVCRIHKEATAQRRDRPAGSLQHTAIAALTSRHAE